MDEAVELRVAAGRSLAPGPRALRPEEVLDTAAQPGHVPGKAVPLGRFGNASLEPFAELIMRVNASSVSTSPSVARIAASDKRDRSPGARVPRGVAKGHSEDRNPADRGRDTHDLRAPGRPHVASR